MNMKEACQAMIDMRRNRARGHRTSFAKGKSFAYTARWKDYSVNYKTNKL